MLGGADGGAGVGRPPRDRAPHPPLRLLLVQTSALFVGLGQQPMSHLSNDIADSRCLCPIVDFAVFLQTMFCSIRQRRYNFMPLARGSAVVGGMTILAVFLAAGMPITASIPEVGDLMRSCASCTVL